MSLSILKILPVCWIMYGHYMGEVTSLQGFKGLIQRDGKKLVINIVMK